LTILLCKTRERIASVVVTVIGSFSVAALFALIRILIALIPGTGARISLGFLGFGTFSTLTSTMVGSWYDLAILAGIVFLISSFTLESFTAKLLPVSKRLRVISIVLCVVSFIFLFLIDLYLIWIGIAVAALGLVLYRFFSSGTQKTVKNLPYFAVIIFIIAALFAWKGNVITGPIIQKMNISYAEVSLPYQYTADIAYPVLTHSPLSTLFGAGPDRFAEQYLLYKPANINNTQFWSSAFPSGSDFIVTSLVDVGAVGAILWILFFGCFVYLGVKALRHLPENHLSKYMLVTSFLTAFFMWLMLFLYTPSHVIILITMIMTGIFLAVFGIEHSHSMIELRDIKWSQSWNGGRTMWLVLWLAVIVSAVGCLVYAKDAIAGFYFQSGINASVAGDAVSARTDFEKALTFKKSDTYYQALAQIDAYQINSIISSASASATTASSTVSTIGSLLNEGIGFARSGQRIDPGNANNFLAEGDLSAIAAALNVPNAYMDARSAYIDGIVLSPMDPSIYLSLGRLDYAEGSTTAAVNEVSDALKLKPDYTDALFEAGVISYNVNNYQTATQAFESVLKIDRTYTNAEYFLGLTFARANDMTDAITIFTDLAKSYPQNTTISTILSDLKNGVSLFSNNGQSSTVGNSPTSSLSLPSSSELMPSKTSTKNTKAKKSTPSASSTSVQ
jgi:tetratricopeptide (TPR) repeat protein